MEDIRNYRIEEDDQKRLDDDRRPDWEALARDEEVPFHIPRD